MIIVTCNDEDLLAYPGGKQSEAWHSGSCSFSHSYE